MTERMEHKSRDEFEALTYEEIFARASKTDACAQLAGEMSAAGAATVGDLPQLRVDVFYHSTGAVHPDITPELLSQAMKDPDLTKAKQQVDEQIGGFVRLVPAPRQTNDPDITLVSLDLHENGFVVRCEVGEGERLQPGGLVALDLRDDLGTPYERAGHGEGFIAYAPAIPAEAEWLQVGTSPETHVDLMQSN